VEVVGSVQPLQQPASSSQPWRISDVPGVGRILVATRDIKQWELVLEDRALVTVPDNHPVCLGCLAPVDGTFTCGGCEWPVCSPQCQKEEQHRVECVIFQNKKIIATVKDYSMRHSMFTCVGVLRVLLLKGVDGQGSEEWNQVMGLMSHWETRKKEVEVAEAIRRMMVFFVERLGMDWVQLEDVQHAFGVLKTNAVGFMNTEARALYPVVSIMSHSCAANLEPVSDPGTCIKFRAKRQIKEGEELCMRYTSFLESGITMRSKLKAEWFFDCGCSRCKDPTEFGSYFSSPKCLCGGYLLLPDCHSPTLTCDVCEKTKDVCHQMEEDKAVEESWKNASLEQLIAIYRNVKKEQHNQYHTVFKIGERLLVLGQKTEDAEILCDIVEAGKHVIETLRIIDRGCSRLMGRCMLLQISSQQKLLVLRREEGRLKDGDYVQAVKELIVGRIRALKMSSSFFSCEQNTSESKNNPVTLTNNHQDSILVTC